MIILDTWALKYLVARVELVLDGFESSDFLADRSKNLVISVVDFEESQEILAVNADVDRMRVADAQEVVL